MSQSIATDRSSPASPEDVQATFAATLVDEWVRGGVGDAVVCPGSRSTPLALALADHPGVAVHVHHDERSGGFLALGLALARDRAVVVLTTSGTAAVELHPAVVEAHHAAVRLLVCTADRPPELRDVGAPQTIDQTRLYGGATRWFGDPGVADISSMTRWRAFAARALAEATGVGGAGAAGPVHLNLPFREPLLGTPGPLPPSRGQGIWTRAGAATSLAASLPIDDLAGRRGLIVAGHPGPDAGDVTRVGEALGCPVVADPRSSAWMPSPVAIAHLDAILRSERARTLLRPEVILRLGAPPASRVVNEWLAASGAEEIVVPGGAWSDSGGTAAAMLPGHPRQVIANLAHEIDRGAGADSGAGVGAGATIRPVEGWLDRWRAVADAASHALEASLARTSIPCEPSVARDVVAALPDGARLVVSSSMPIRDVERYAVPRRGVQVLANRGANGIDGVVSTAVGVALAERGAAGAEPGSARPTGLLIGDLAFLHDSNGLLGAVQRGIDLVCVVLDNDGGGIFSFLPQATSLPESRFETLFGTPHGLDLVALAAAYGVTARAVEGEGDVAKAVSEAVDQGGTHVLVVRTDRAANVTLHQSLDRAVAAAVENALAPLTRRPAR